MTQENQKLLEIVDNSSYKINHYNQQSYLYEKHQTPLREIPVNDFGYIPSWSGTTNSILDDVCPFCFLALSKPYGKDPMSDEDRITHYATCQEKYWKDYDFQNNFNFEVNGDDLAFLYPVANKYVQFLSSAFHNTRSIRFIKDWNGILITVEQLDPVFFEQRIIDHLAKWLDGIKFQSLSNSVFKDDAIYGGTGVSYRIDFVQTRQNDSALAREFERMLPVRYEGHWMECVSRRSQDIQERGVGGSSWVGHPDPRFIDWNDSTVNERIAQAKKEKEELIKSREVVQN